MTFRVSNAPKCVNAAVEDNLSIDLADLSDEALVDRCREERPNTTVAFHELLNRYEGMVYHTCLRMLGSVEEAEETCQDAWVKVYQKLHQFEGRSTFKTWLFRVAYNHCMTRRRNLATRRERGVAIEEELSRESEDKNAPETAGELDLSENVNRAIDRLKPDDKEVIMLRFINDLSLEEIAEVLGLGLSATKMRLYRAMDRFKVIYESGGGSE